LPLLIASIAEIFFLEKSKINNPKKIKGIILKTSNRLSIYLKNHHAVRMIKYHPTYQANL
jgi:hypothetical protein